MKWDLEKGVEWAAIGLTGGLTFAAVDLFASGKADLDGLLGFAGGLIGAFGAVYLTGRNDRRRQSEGERRERNLVASILEHAADDVERLALDIRHSDDFDAIEASEGIVAAAKLVGDSLASAEQYGTTLNFLFRALLANWPGNCKKLSVAARGYRAALEQHALSNPQFTRARCDEMRAQLLDMTEHFVAKSRGEMAAFLQS